MADEAKRKQPLDLHIRCGCGATFSLELDHQPSWLNFTSEILQLSRTWVATHGNCKEAALRSREGSGE